MNDIAPAKPDYIEETVTAFSVFKDCCSISKQDAPMFNFNVTVRRWHKPDRHLHRINPAYRFNSKALLLALRGIKQKQPTIAVGPTGVGKTELFENIAARLGMPLLTINFDSGVGKGNLVGAMALTPNPGGPFPLSKFLQGDITRAVINGLWLLLDEVSLMKPEIAYILTPIMTGRPLRVTENGQDVTHHLHPDFRLMATDNTKLDGGTESINYVGTNEQSAAFRSRWLTWIELEDHEREEIEDLLLRHVPGLKELDNDAALRFAELAYKAKAAHQQGNLSTRIDLRQLIAAAQSAVSLYVETGKRVDAKDCLNFGIEGSIINRCSAGDEAGIRGILPLVFN